MKPMLDDNQIENYLAQNTSSLLKDLREDQLSFTELDQLIKEEKKAKNRAKINNAIAVLMLAFKEQASQADAPVKAFDREPDKNCACPKCGNLVKADEPPTCKKCGTQMIYR